MRRHLCTVAAVVAAATMIVAPFVALGATIVLGLAWLPRFRRWAWPAVAVVLVALASAWLLPPSWPPQQRTPAQHAATANLLTSGGVVNAEAVAAWRVDGAEVWRPVDADALGPGAVCMRLEAGGRAFQVASWPAGVRSLRAVAELNDVPVGPTLSGAVLELRVGAHGGPASGTRFVPPFDSALEHVHAIGSERAPDRLVASIWNRGTDAAEVCIDRLVVVPGPASANGLPPSPLALAGFAPTGISGRTATATHVVLRFALFGLAFLAWRALWRRRARLLHATFVATSFALPIVLVAHRYLLLDLDAPGWLPHRNFVAAGMVAVVLLALSGMRGPVVRGAAVAIVAAALMALDARAAAWGLTVALFAAMVSPRRAAVAAILASAVPAVALVLGTSGSWVGLDEARARVFEAAWSAFLDAPWLGHGFGRSADVLSARLADDPILFGHAHNVFLELALESGVAGLGLGLTLATFALVFAFRASPWHGGAVVALLFASLFDIVLLAPTGYLVAACVVAGASVVLEERGRVGP